MTRTASAVGLPTRRVPGPFCPATFSTPLGHNGVWSGPKARGPMTPEAVDAYPERIYRALHDARSEILAEYLEPHSFPWIVGFSGGKDSALVAQLVYEMLLDLAPSDRKRPVHIISNDTLVESPILIDFIDKTLARLRRSAEALRLPITVEKTTPSVEQTFWVNLIGRGYPSPNRNFRWCTDRLKIQPTSNYIRSQVSAAGQVILLLGVRR